MEELVEFIKTGKNADLKEKLDANPSLVAIKTPQGISLLQFAAYCRNQEAVDTLKRHVSNLDVFEASSLGDLEAVKRLLAEKPEALNAFSVDGFTPLGLASFFGHLPVVTWLLRKGANPNVASNNPFKVTPLHSDCAISSFEIAELLIVHGADINAQQMQGVTPLHSAAHHGQTRLASLLIDKGAIINAKMDNGQTPLFMAREKNFQEISELLIKYGGF